MKNFKIFLAFLLSTVTLFSVACKDNGGSASSSVISSSITDSSSPSKGSSSASSDTASSSISSSVSDESSSSSSDSSSSSQTCQHNFNVVSSQNPTEQADGYINYKCDKCSETYTKTLPKLSSDSYSVTVTDATCTSNKITEYKSDEYGNYRVEAENSKLHHTTYGGLCQTCNQTINNLYFDGAGTQVTDGGGYPRLYTIKDGTILCGWDTGKIVVAKSTDNGATWSDAVQISPADFNDYNCANVSFYQMSSGEILCSYRVQANFTSADTEGRLYKREIHTSISRDNGVTWQYLGLVSGAYNYKAEPKAHVDVTNKKHSDVNNAIKAYPNAGVFEPFMGEINGEIVCWYADDITPLLEAQRKGANQAETYRLNYETQYIFQKTLNLSTMTWTNRRIIHDGTIVKSCVDGIADYSRDGMPVFAKLNLPEHEGWYVSVIEGTYRRRQDWGSHPFIILMSLSKDYGQTWSTPKEVYVPRYDTTKASAPYVVATEDDRLIISFQTEEDCSMAGLIGDKHPDAVSVMKVMISDGTPVDEIVGNENFYDAVNPFNAPPGSCTSWNGMMIADNELWCCTGSNYPTGSIRINKSKIPVLDTFSKKDILTNVTSTDNISIRNGDFKKKEDWFVTSDTKSLCTFKNYSLTNGTFSCDIIPGRNCDSGIIFKASSTVSNFWETNSSYYTLLINKEGIVLLGKITNGKWTCPAEFDLRKLSTVYKCYINMNAVYNLKVIVNGNNIKCFVNDFECINIIDDNMLQGTMVGIRSSKTSYFSNFKLSDSTDRKDKIYSVSDGTEVKSGSVTVNGTTVKSTSEKALCVVKGIAYNGTITCKITPKVANDCGIVFRISACADNYWEQAGTSYYVLLINAQGWLLLGKITNGVWSCPANFDMRSDFDVNREYELKVEMDGKNIKCYVDGELKIDLDDSSVIKGTGFGVRSAQASTEFKDFTVKA